MAKAKEVKAPPFPIATSNRIASEETQATPNPARNVTLEDADLRTANDREIYAVRVVDRVKSTPAAGTGRNYKIFKKNIPVKAITTVGEVADEIVRNAF